MSFFGSVWSGVKNIGKKVVGAAKYIGKKAQTAGHFIGKKVAMPVLAAIPGVGEIAAGGIALAGSISAGTGGLARVADAIGAGTKAAETGNVKDFRKAIESGKAGASSTKKAYTSYRKK